MAGKAGESGVLRSRSGCSQRAPDTGGGGGDVWSKNPTAPAASYRCTTSGPEPPLTPGHQNHDARYTATFCPELPPSPGDHENPCQSAQATPAYLEGWGGDEQTGQGGRDEDEEEDVASRRSVTEVTATSGRSMHASASKDITCSSPSPRGRFPALELSFSSAEMSRITPSSPCR